MMVERASNGWARYGLVAVTLLLLMWWGTVTAQAQSVVNNTATVSADEIDSAPGNNSDAVCVPLDGTGNMALGGASVSANENDVLVDNSNSFLCLLVNGANSAPTITQPLGEIATVTIPENTMVVTDVNTTDDTGIEGNGTLTYTVSGPDAGSFTIDANGVLRFVTAPDYENPGSVAGSNVYSVTVTVIDTGGLADSVAINVVVTDLLESDAVSVPLKVILGGAYQSDSGLMREALRGLPDFPLVSPYGGGEMIADSSVLTTHAIVDWVLVELRDAMTATNVVATRAALLQADGDVVDLDGMSTLVMSGTMAGAYHVAVHHRNHLGIMTAAPMSLTLTSAPIDLTTQGTAAHGNFARQLHNVTGVAMMWPGDVNGDGQVIGAGPGNDRSALYLAVLAAPGNQANLDNYQVTGYHAADLNLDGIAYGAGPDNDNNVILSTIFNYSLNGDTSHNFIVAEQLP